MTNDQIQQLRTLVGAFEGMYTNGPARLSAIRTVYVSDPGTLVIPNFRDGEGGSCGDISSLLAAKLHHSGLISEVNKKNQNNPIRIYTAQGHNTSHFQKGFHVWTALARESDHDFRNMVVLDGSYQQISHIQTNGYKVSRAEQPVAKRRESKEVFQTARMDIYENSIQVYSAEDEVLGLSRDKSVSFGLGFTRFHRKFIPFIRVVDTHEGDAVFLINPNSHHLNCAYRDTSFELTETAASEVKRMLDSASQFQFLPIKEAPDSLLRKTHIRWEP